MGDPLESATPKRCRSQILSLAGALTERDKRILLDVNEHRVLTTNHIAELHFPSLDRARKRLLKLFNYGVLDRFRPNVERGSAPEHHVLATMGATLVAAQLGVAPAKIFSKEQLATLAYHPHMKHLLAINGFFSRLIWACRQSDGIVLTDWWGEARTRRRWAKLVLPDAYGKIEGTQSTRSFFLEIDRGTESVERLTNKLLAYDLAVESEDAPDLLLFCFPSARREASARNILRHCGFTVATTHLEMHQVNPLGDNWLPIGLERRYPILEVPD